MLPPHGEVVDVVGGIVGLLLVSAAALAFCKRTKLPFTIVLVVIGVGLVHLAENGLGFLQPLFQFREGGAEVILFVFLPTLIFESAFSLDARQLRQNLVPILTLAVPGMLLSTVIIGAVVGWLTPIGFRSALVLGAILSATDPVAVIALFKKLGAPRRLTVLVEGESLFNDATAIVASRILVGVAVAGVMTPATAFEGIVSFVVIFFGGIAVGLALAWICAMLLGLVESDPFIEISLTTVLAYGSFILAEHVLQVSGVMATVAAAVTMGSWGRAKISPSVFQYLRQFWEFLAYVANCLIFLLVGLSVKLGQLGDDALLVVIVAMLISRAVVVFGLVPLIGRLSTPVNLRYQAVMYWGGLRGAIALAIALQLPMLAAQFDPQASFEEADHFVPLVTGAVLFTLLVPGLTMERLVRRLRLDQPPLADRLARIAGLLTGKQRAAERIPELQQGGLFSARIANAKQQQCAADIEKLQGELTALRNREMDADQERQLVFLRGFAAEKSYYYEMYGKGHLSERAFRELSLHIAQQAEEVGYEGRLPDQQVPNHHSSAAERLLMRIADRFLGFTPLPERLRATRTARDYEIQWGRRQGAAAVLVELDELAQTQASTGKIVDEVRGYFQAWHEDACRRIDDTAAQFPEFVAAMQERLADRLIVQASSEAIDEADRAGTIPHGVAEHMQDEFSTEIRDLRSVPFSQLQVDPHELLNEVPFFRDTPPEEFDRVAKLLREHTARAGESIIVQGERDDSLYLIARGVIRICREDGGVSRDVATLMAGDFFGELALLHQQPRTATCRAVTPCSLFQLRRVDFHEVVEACPAIKEALTQAERQRRSRS